MTTSERVGAGFERRVSRRTLFRVVGSTAAVGVGVGALGAARWAFGSGDTASAAGAPRAAVGIMPTAANTGVIPGSTLTAYTGNMVITQPGTVVQNMDIRGNIAVRANNVTIRNCFVRGVAVAPSSGSYAMIMQYSNSVTGLLVEDCTLLPQSPNQSTNGIQGTGMTVRRCDVSNGVDGVNAMGAGRVLVDSCYIHDGAYFTPSNTHPDNQSHDDAAQITSGTNITYSNNNLSSFYTSCLMIGQLQGPLVNLRIVDNWLDGGAAAININSANYGRFAPVVTGNKFGRSRTNTYQILVAGDVDISNIQGNVWQDSGQAVKVVVK